MKTLVIDTATAACSVALLERGALIARAHETVERGHAERLLPMIAELPDGGRAAHILVDVGPGSFTGIRVGIAAARGLAFGWSTSVAGYSSLALIAAAAFEDDVPSTLAVVLEGGHGEVFMQGFAAPSTGPMVATDALVSLLPADALVALAGRPAYGSGARWLTAIDPAVDAREALPDAARALLLPDAFVTLPPRPMYGRAPDAKIPVPRA
ncbi:tRNA (adenosine(37)-N6)-threonylcarbamoyltransferase complex dimerization subunit type 1 TsaB [Sphingomonas sp. SUN019]|uniref:tRNA (adenosine(37)-N6)-threonylcarbamoyltransferase complex dimerization subunit type 1 TsaB n=1 Tax=Sphingomonas sp. SUN019 TaxID=2937788 RepID=UPI002164EB4E|nr:tRNA (adenosine(37)-N6)-threonylcarbamoyltransferase complex dimerization subunit type 1 TsaB [Sphingomonas sp. SUN019]UVO49886.1 tRNA (adenosine(37)-N6)-threonylcarbamoyltransferase complex dimerization subunit type 1 TsaB [Sphingomonas sp. SUN019]